MGKRDDSKAKNSLFSCSRQLLLHCSTFCIHAVVNENFLTQIATRLAPENDYVLLRIGIERWLFNKIANRAPLPTTFT